MKELKKELEGYQQKINILEGYQQKINILEENMAKRMKEESEGYQKSIKELEEKLVVLKENQEIKLDQIINM